jgi:hypothetical protein
MTRIHHKGTKDTKEENTEAVINRQALSSAFLLCALCVFVVTPVFAAPPSVTYLFPAGGQRGTTVEVSAGGTFERWPIQVRASNAGITAKAVKEKGKLIVTVAAAVEPGRHWLWLYDDQGASVAQPFMVGTLPEIREHEPNDDARAAQKLPFAAATVNGRFDKPGDVDCYSVSLQKGQTLVADFEGWANLRSPMDAILQVVSADGFVLEQNNDYHGLDPFIAFPAPKDGVYTVRTFAFPAVPDSSIRFAGGESYVYRLTLTTGGYADHPWPLAVARNRPDPVDLVGWNTPPAARRLAVNAGGLARHTAIDQPAVANRINVGVEPHACVVKPDSAEPFRIDPPMTVSGRLARPRAVDEYLLHGKKSQALTIRAESQEWSLPTSAVIRVTDSAGKELGRAEPAGLHSDTELAFSPPADGDYRLTVRDIYADGGPRFAYRLRVAPPEPNFAATVAVDRFAVVAGQVLDLPVVVQRLHGLTGEIAWSVEDLPPGVDATVDMGKDPAKVMVKLTAKPEATAAGPFRIVGRMKTATRAATAPLPAPFDGAPAVRMEWLWLTVTRPALPAKVGGF